MKNQIIVLSFVFLTICGCQNNLVKNNTRKSNKDPFTFKEWYFELEKDTSEMKKAWLEFFDPFSYSSKKYLDIGLNVFLEGENPSAMDVIPVVNYVIRYQAFINWNGRDPLESLMELSFDKASCYIANKSDIKCMVFLRLEEDKWNATEWGPLEKSTGEIISNIYFVKKNFTININLECQSGVNPYTRNYIAYKENGIYMSIGGKTSILTNDLLEFQKELKLGQKIK